MQPSFPHPSAAIRWLHSIPALLPLLAIADLAQAAPAQAQACLRDLRVFLDFDADTATFASWPLDNSPALCPGLGQDDLARAKAPLSRTQDAHVYFLVDLEPAAVKH